MQGDEQTSSCPPCQLVPGSIKGSYCKSYLHYTTQRYHESSRSSSSNSGWECIVVSALVRAPPFRSTFLPAKPCSDGFCHLISTAPTAQLCRWCKGYFSDPSPPNLSAVWALLLVALSPRIFFGLSSSTSIDRSREGHPASIQTIQPTPGVNVRAAMNLCKDVFLRAVISARFFGRDKTHLEVTLPVRKYWSCKPPTRLPATPYFV